LTRAAQIEGTSIGQYLDVPEKTGTRASRLLPSVGGRSVMPQARVEKSIAPDRSPAAVHRDVSSVLPPSERSRRSGVRDPT
jgi:hypothetical protein